MSEQLVNYILGEIRNGHKTDSIESFLKTHGYNHTDVEASLTTAMDLTAKSYIPYIESQVKAGYELHVIRTSLITQGYDQRIIDYAINHYFNNFFKQIEKIFTPKEKTPEVAQLEQTKEQVTDLIKTSLSKGLTLETIRSTLLQQGYDQALVNAEINKYYHSHFHISKQTAFAALAVLLAIVLVGGLGYGVFFAPKEANTNGSSGFSSIKSEERLLDVTASNAFPKQAVYAGDNVNFNVDIDNMGTQREYDLYFTYALETISGEKLRTKKVTKSTISSMNDYIELPQNIEPGTYVLRVTVDYHGDVPAESYFEFVVSTVDEPEAAGSQQGSEQETEPVQETETKKIPTRTTVDTGSQTPLEPGTYLSRNYLTDEEKTQLEEYIATQGSEYALYKCRQIIFKALEAECKYYVVMHSDNIDDCMKLDEGIKQDKCYLEFAKSSTDLSICDRMSDKTVISSCKMHVLSNKNKELQGVEDADFYAVFTEVYGSGSSEEASSSNST